MDWTDWTYWTHRVGRRHNTWTHRWIELQFVGGDVGYIHHSDDCVTGNDILHYRTNHFRNYVTSVHDGHYGRGLLDI
jgi:hypothetical protein